MTGLRSKALLQHGAQGALLIGFRNRGGFEFFMKHLIWFIACILSSYQAQATSLTASAFDEANKLYEQGKFDDAAVAYQKLAEKGEISEAIYFNWGNALFKAGKIGRAIAAYQEAERLSPRDPDVRANLRFARNQVQGPTLLPKMIWRWLGELTLNEWTWLAAGSFWLWLILLIVLQWRPSLKGRLRTWAICFGAVVSGLCVCFGAAFYSERLDERAIVVVSEAVVRQAPLDESHNALTLHDGAELQVLDRKDQWLQVRADVRSIGWIRRGLVLLKPAI
jgi:tetratricopeptide (TPR) repeat protein